jgi:L-seryl-tRNA(Ser) seleniumtransferase
MFRALRLDKLIYQALETTLRHLLLERWDEIPALRMIAQSPTELRERAERLANRLQGISLEIVAGESVIGGGSTPEQSLAGWVIAISCADVVEAERRCRAGDPPVIARIENDRLVFDLRTVFPEEEEILVTRVRSCC